jgi:hypothetical protein
MDLLSVLAGIFLVGFAAFDVFHTLFHPVGHGSISDAIGRYSWKLFKHLARGNIGRLTTAGPSIILLVMVSWVSLVVFGFSFIYFPYIGNQFVVSPGLNPANHKSYFDALNVSIGGIMTLTGDFYTRSKLLRLAMGVEAILGFGLLAASVSWLLSLYPALERRRSAAHELSLMHYAELHTGQKITQLPQGQATIIIWGLVTQVATLRNDLIQFPITYYFHSGEENTGLAGALPFVISVADEASRPQMPASLRLAGTALGGAVYDYLEFIAEMYLDVAKDDKHKIVRRYAEDQMYSIMDETDVTAKRAA